MTRMMVASSPVEIEAKADEIGLPPTARAAALEMFHDLTNRLGQAANELSVAHEDWPNHRFYFGTPGEGMAALVDGLRARPDIVEVTGGTGVATPGAAPAGLYVQVLQDGHLGVLVGHEDHDRLSAAA